jgi:hypothetical protein
MKTMKLSQLSPEQKTRLLDELNGGPRFGGWDSYDAIIPLVQKLWAGKILGYNGNWFAKHLIDLGLIKDCCENCTINSVFKATPSQLCDAVLVATGKAEI